MTHRQPAPFGSPVFHIRAPVCIFGVGRSPPDFRPPPGLPDSSPSARPTALRPQTCRSYSRHCPQPRQISGRREASNRATCHTVFHRLARHRCHMRYKTRPAHPCSSRTRDKIRPAPAKHPKIAVLLLAGRTFSRHDMPHRSSRKLNTHVRAFGSARGPDDTHVSPKIYPWAS